MKKYEEPCYCKYCVKLRSIQSEFREDKELEEFIQRTHVRGGRGLDDVELSGGSEDDEQG